MSSASDANQSTAGILASSSLGLVGHGDSIELHGLEFECRIGITHKERTKPQPIQANIRIFIDTYPAAVSGKLTDTIDFVRVAAEIRFILEEGGFFMLESAAQAMASYLLSTSRVSTAHTAIQAVAIDLIKPNVKTAAKGRCGNQVVRIFRMAGSVPAMTHLQSFGQLETLFNGTECSLHRIILNPRQTILLGGMPNWDESDMILGSTLHVQNRKVLSGNRFRWPKGTLRKYENRTHSQQVLLCIDRATSQPFIEKINPVVVSYDLPWVDPDDYYLGIPAEYINT